MRKPWFVVGLGTAAVVAAAMAVAAPSQAATAAPGYTVSDWATGFVSTSPTNGVGPIGIAARGSEIWVGDDPTGRLYKFDQTAGGVADAAHEVTVAPIAGVLTGIAFSKDDRLYAALQGNGQVVELSETDGHVIRVVAAGLTCVTGIATDPISGDLFVSQPCSIAGVKRLSNFGSGAATVTQYAVTQAIDGLAFGPDGTLYASSSNTIYRISGTDKPDAGTATPLASVSGGDGIAVAASADISQPPFLLANLNGGVIRKIDLTTSPPTLSNVITGGTRGDFVTVGSNGCLYATQSATVVKVTLADGSCNLAPAIPNQPPTAAFTFSPSPARATHAVSFDGTGSSDPDGTIVSYAWDFGDGSTGSGATPAHAYAAPGNYSVTLTVTDDDGATASVTHVVTVLAQRLGTFSCTATAARVLGTALATANPADSPCRADSTGALRVAVAPIAVVDVARSTTSQNPAVLAGTDPSPSDKATADAAITDARVNLGALALRVTGLASHAEVRCDANGQAVFGGASSLASLTINGVSYVVGSGPVDIPVLIGTLHINSTVQTPGRLVQRALWLQSALGNVVLGETQVNTEGLPCA